MKKQNKRNIAKSALVLLSLVGGWSAIGHYMPQPDTAFVLEHNPPPGIEWYLQQMPQYVTRPVLTALHVVPAFLFMVIAPFQLSQRIRNRHPGWHRVAGRVMVLVSMSIGISGIIIGIVMPFGGEFERVVSVTIGAIFLSTLSLGVLRARQKRFVEHRRWMLRMLATGFVPITMRGLMISGVILFDMSAPAIFGPTMLLGLILNFVIIELKFQRDRQAPKGRNVAVPISAT